MSKGIDIPIDNLVTDFNSSLWNGKNNQFYGRVFRNERFADFGSKISPEIWLSANEPAIELLKNDNYDAQCFFDVQPNDPVTGVVHKSTIWICVMVNLIKLYPSLTRQDAAEQVQRDVQELVNLSEFEIIELTRGFKGFAEYDWGDTSERQDSRNRSNRSDQAKADMHPHYCFRFDTNLEYINSNC